VSSFVAVSGRSKGRYKALLKLFGMSTRNYRRFMNFLAAHDCGVGFREFRGPVTSSGTPPENLPPYAAGAESADGSYTGIVPPSAGRPLDDQPAHR
jgi:hypothetical protein